MRRGFAAILLVGIIATLAILGTTIYFKQNNKLPTFNSPANQSALQSSPAPTPDETTNPDSIGANWKTYVDEDAKFILKYPTAVKLTNNYNPYPDTLTLLIQTKAINSLGGISGSHGYDRETALKDRPQLGAGKYGEKIDWDLLESRKVLRIGKTYAKNFMVLNRVEICNVAFERILIFYNLDYQVTIILSAPVNQIISEMPEYFMEDETCGAMRWNYNQMPEFYRTLLDNNGSKTAQEWFNTFDQILSTFKFTK